MQISGDIVRVCEYPDEAAERRVSAIGVLRPQTGSANPPVDSLGIGLEIDVDYDPCPDPQAVTVSMNGSLTVIAVNSVGQETESGHWRFTFQV